MNMLWVVPGREKGSRAPYTEATFSQKLFFLPLSINSKLSLNS